MRFTQMILNEHTVVCNAKGAVEESSLICWHQVGQLGLQKSNCENAVQSSSLWQQIRSLHFAQPQPGILSPGNCQVGLRF